MKLNEVIYGKSLERPGHTRMTGYITLNSKERIQIWIEVEDKNANDLSRKGNLWLIAMIPLAATSGEKIVIDLPTDNLLIENVSGIIQIWKSWGRKVFSFEIDCRNRIFEELESKQKTAAFFSGGIDAFSTIGRNHSTLNNSIPRVGKIDELITVWGFDIGVNDHKAYAEKSASLKNAATGMNLPLLEIRTNLRLPNTPWFNQWGLMTFGLGLSFLALALEERYSRVLLGASYTYDQLIPRGSHPMLDPLASTSSLAIVHDGAALNRIERTHIVCQMPEAYKSLHVCQAEGESNCSQCEKCWRTMTAIDLAGYKGAFATRFDWTKYTPALLARMLIRGHSGKVFYDELLSEAVKLNRKDIEKAIKKAKFRSKIINSLLNIADKLKGRPALWRVSSLIYRFAGTHFITKKYIKHAFQPTEKTQQKN